MSLELHTSQPQPEDRFAFLYVDLNSFFASVEQQLNENYRGKPLAVVPTDSDTTACIAVSYEAKACGIKTGTLVGEAKRLCPEIILIHGNHTEYSKYSRAVSKAVETVCPVVRNPSIDEMVCQLIGREQLPANARRIALDIKQAIYRDVGVALRCSIGMAPNQYLAKIASDMQKPDGLIGLLPSQLPRAISHLDLRALPGVGARTEARLNAKGIHTMPELLALDRPAMHKLWNSVWGDRLYHWLRGHVTGDEGAPIPTDIQKSLGHSHVLAPEHRTVEGSWSVAHKLLHKAAMRLRLEKFYAGSMALHLRYALNREQADRLRSKQHFSGLKHTGWGMEARFPYAQDTLTLLEVLQMLWKKQPQGPDFVKPFFVGVTMGRLLPENEHNPGLFTEQDRRTQLSSTIDQLNLKHGHTTVHFAGMMAARNSAPTRIAFTQIPQEYGSEWM